MQWLRLYTDILDNHKIQQLPAPIFKNWIGLLCVARRHNGILPSIREIAFLMRIDVEYAVAMLRDLTENGLIDTVQGHLMPHNWGKRQFRSDEDPTAYNRVRAHRERKKQEKDTRITPVSDTPNETRPEQSRTEQSRTEQNLKNTNIRELLSSDGEERGKVEQVESTRIPKGWEPSENDAVDATSYGLFPSDLAGIRKEFIDHYSAKHGDWGKSPDWSAKWRQWCRTAARKRKLSPRTEVEVSVPISPPVWVPTETKAYEKWTEHWKSIRGVSPPVTTKDGIQGWFFATEFPPEFNPTQEAPPQ